MNGWFKLFDIIVRGGVLLSCWNGGVKDQANHHLKSAAVIDKHKHITNPKQTLGTYLVKVALSGVFPPINGCIWDESFQL